MKKLGKVIGLLLIILVLAIALTTNVKAAETLDLSGYNEIGGEDDISTNETTTPSAVEEEKTNKTEAATPSTTKNETKTETTTETKSDVSTTGIAQTGSVAVTAYIVSGIVCVVALGIGYVKLKKYSF